MKKLTDVKRLIQSRQGLPPVPSPGLRDEPQAAEGGCGVIGIACSEPIAGRHLLQALDQMRNRGNGKGGGIAAVGLDPGAFGVTQQTLEEDTLLAVAYLDPACREAVERAHIYPTFVVDHVRVHPHLEDHRALPGLEFRPPEVVTYFVRVKESVIKAFRQTHHLAGLSRRQIEDEIVYQNSFRLNKTFYAATGETRAFVLSHGKNLLVLKMVGYGDDVIRYYRLEELTARVWIGHHRYPTKGRVWHPGGAHPFVGLNEALVHNGDFANYASITEYLAQRNIAPLFLTDTEVSVLVFDLLHRVYGYPLEYVIEALAPTTERDFTMLPPEKQQVYEMIQATHMHCSPDGPWFFLIAQSDREEGEPAYRLTGITDTSMLRPQVFALQQGGENGPAIGFAASEKQAIDAALQSLAAEDSRFWNRADRYWNARGGSHTDGGAFLFSVYPNAEAGRRMICTDKFGCPVDGEPSRPPFTRVSAGQVPPCADDDLTAWIKKSSSEEVWQRVRTQIARWTYHQVLGFLETLLATTGSEAGAARAFEVLAFLMDQRYSLGNLRRSSLLALYDQTLERLVDRLAETPLKDTLLIQAGETLPPSILPHQTVVLRADGFPPDGPASAAMHLKRLSERGARRIIITRCRGHRFLGSGLGVDTHGMRMDVFGSSGDYLGSGIDGMDIYVHGNAQDQLGQIMKAGKLVVYGDVGQTFGYAAKGGEVYILGNAAGRPLINAVGHPRVVINGTSLDYLAESFMAGDPHHGGGFVVLNGIRLTDEGKIEELKSPYPGGNLFSLASGGAIFLRDPHHKVEAGQLNGGAFFPFQPEDWALIQPYLEENGRLFGISIDRLLTVNGERRSPGQVYRKITPRRVRALQAEEAWVRQT